MLIRKLKEVFSVIAGVFSTWSVFSISDLYLLEKEKRALSLPYLMKTGCKTSVAKQTGLRNCSLELRNGAPILSCLQDALISC